MPWLISLACWKPRRKVKLSKLSKINGLRWTRVCFCTAQLCLTDSVSCVKCTILCWQMALLQLQQVLRAMQLCQAYWQVFSRIDSKLHISHLRYVNFTPNKTFLYFFDMKWWGTGKKFLFLMYETPGLLEKNIFLFLFVCVSFLKFSWNLSRHLVVFLSCLIYFSIKDSSTQKYSNFWMLKDYSI